MGNQLIVDLPVDLKQRLKMYCVKNGNTMSDEVIGLICRKLEQEELGQNVPKSEKESQKEVIDDLDSPVKVSYDEPVDHSVSHGWTHIKKEVLEAELKPIREKLENLKISLAECVACSKLERFEEINKKFAVTGKLIDSVMVAIEKTSSAKKCDDDRKGLEYLKTPIPKLEISSTIVKVSLMDKTVDDIFRGTLLE